MNVHLRNALRPAILVREHVRCLACRQPTLLVQRKASYDRERCIGCGQEHHVHARALPVPKL